MNTKTMERFNTLNAETLATVEGGFWGLFLGGAISAFDGGPTLEQLNGKKLPTPRSCSPYGTGGTPNAC
ncbi:Blp family class II bacteriocin [Streptococcus ovuberis]|uniref:ComC/BlpC family peptide pheromone/bacteriocin n=1 Tax=Streptococcus ovuberis TaxID=1936207 RepID=A0A7X6MYB5_9STRE|nr:Blp family class II bacteriocin [Streptococcus ovuberis]NKZ20136.1 ComC/BlpC family peptide pheromone/bacteriocin [Streptococcus ovuberis]